MNPHPKSLESRVSKRSALVSKPAAVSLMEAAAMLSIGRSSMQKLVREKAVRSYKIGRSLRISVASLDEFVANLEKLGIAGGRAKKR